MIEKERHTRERCTRERDADDREIKMQMIEIKMHLCLVCLSLAHLFHDTDASLRCAS